MTMQSMAGLNARSLAPLPSPAAFGPEAHEAVSRHLPALPPLVVPRVAGTIKRLRSFTLCALQGRFSEQCI